ncbi:VTT domain-containing protein [Roseivirga sp.]|uniref:VTT domain-containing protein n=1 Tax=Roseivirga sp. TaxID=1964215 RepID=UPI003B8B19FA
MANNKREFYSFFSKNIIKGFIYLIVLIVLLILFKSYFKSQYEIIEYAVSDSYYLMFFIFLVSEIFVGILPPELFMFWSLDDPWHYYITAVSTMTMVSLFAGWLNYRLGRVLGKKEFFLNLFQKRLKLKKYQQKYDQYGSGLIIVAALTPLPFALISMLTGTLAYPQKKYLLFASFRIIRFVVYGIIVWNLDGVI